MIATPYATRCAVLALLVSCAALAYQSGHNAGRQSCLHRPIATLSK